MSDISVEDYAAARRLAEKMLYEGGYSLREIGIAFGVSHMTVKRDLCNLGVSLRPEGRTTGRTQVT